MLLIDVSAKELARYSNLPILHIGRFIRRAGDIATCIYYTGIDPFTKQQVYFAKGLRDRKLRAP
jgi:hypothetical protein